MLQEEILVQHQNSVFVLPMLQEESTLSLLAPVERAQIAAIITTLPSPNLWCHNSRQHGHLICELSWVGPMGDDTCVVRGEVDRFSCIFLTKERCENIHHTTQRSLVVSPYNK